jgi:hypothetical protein
MSKRDDERIAKLAKKNAEKVVRPKRDRTQFDPTLRQSPDNEEPETERFFKEMKRREF